MPTRPQLRHPDRHPQEGVVIGYIHPGQVSGKFCSSLMDTIQYDLQNRCHIYGQNGGGTIELQSGPRIAEARSQVVEGFLTQFPYATWLLMIDSDMEWTYEDFDKLMQVANDEHPIVGGLCVAGGDQRQFATVYRLNPGEQGPECMPIPFEEIPEDQLVKCDATGAAFLLVHRKVLIAMLRPWPEGFGTTADGSHNPHPWFVEGLAAGKQWGEDIAFCMRANALGFPLHVHTGIHIGHVKPRVLNWNTLAEHARAKTEAVEVD